MRNYQKLEIVRNYKINIEQKLELKFYLQDDGIYKLQKRITVAYKTKAQMTNLNKIK